MSLTKLASGDVFDFNDYNKRKQDKEEVKRRLNPQGDVTDETLNQMESRLNQMEKENLELDNDANRAMHQYNEKKKRIKELERGLPSLDAVDDFSPQHFERVTDDFPNPSHLKRNLGIAGLAATGLGGAGWYMHHRNQQNKEAGVNTYGLTKLAEMELTPREELEQNMAWTAGAGLGAGAVGAKAVAEGAREAGQSALVENKYLPEELQNVAAKGARNQYLKHNGHPLRLLGQGALRKPLGTLGGIVGGGLVGAGAYQYQKAREQEGQEQEKQAGLAKIANGVEDTLHRMREENPEDRERFNQLVNEHERNAFGVEVGQNMYDAQRRGSTLKGGGVGAGIGALAGAAMKKNPWAAGAGAMLGAFPGGVVGNQLYKAKNTDFANGIAQMENRRDDTLDEAQQLINQYAEGGQ